MKKKTIVTISLLALILVSAVYIFFLRPKAGISTMRTFSVYTENGDTSSRVLNADQQYIFSFKEHYDDFFKNIIASNKEYAFINIIDGIVTDIEIDGKTSSLHYIKNNQNHNFKFYKIDDNGLHLGLFLIVRDPNKIKLAERIQITGIDCKRHNINTGSNSIIKNDESEYLDMEKYLIDEFDFDFVVTPGEIKKSGVTIPYYVNRDSSNQIKFNILVSNKYNNKGDYMIIALKNYEQIKINNQNRILVSLNPHEQAVFPVIVDANKEDINKTIFFVIIPNPYILQDAKSLSNEIENEVYISQRMFIQ